MEQITHEEHLGEGLRYTEKWIADEGKRPRRYYELWKEGVEGHIAHLELVPFEQRMGCVSTPAEGYASVVTAPLHRRKGYTTRLFTVALERAAKRVDVVYLYGVRRLYPKFGFTGCLVDNRMRLAVRDGEVAVRPTGIELRRMEERDFAPMSELYNREHAVRPWTHVRVTTSIRGPRKAQEWDAGEVGLVAERDGHVAGYAIVPGLRYGVLPPAIVTEICADTTEVAGALIHEIAVRAIEYRQETIAFLEPPDSTIGRALRRLGAELIQRTVPDGDGMGKILNRARLVRALEPELSRRGGVDTSLLTEELADARICPNDGLMLQLLTGAYSWRDAEDEGIRVPERYVELFRTCFPGACDRLPVAHTHAGDRY